MEIVAHLTHLLNGNILWQEPVQLVGEISSIHRQGLHIEVGNHHTGMDTGIGTASTRHGNILSQNRGESPLQLLLHGTAVGLYLPSVIASAVITEGDEESHSLYAFSPMFS